MLTLTAKLNELNDDGLLLARLVQNDDFSTIEGSTVRMNKFSSVALRSQLTRSERTRIFDGMGNKRSEPLSDAEDDRLSRVVGVYGDDDRSLYSFSPVRWLYEYGNRCMHCVDVGDHQWWAGNCCGKPDHPKRLANSTDHAELINNIGAAFRSYIHRGHFNPIAPREPNLQVELALNALFGKSNHHGR